MSFIENIKEKAKKEIKNMRSDVDKDYIKRKK